MYAQLKSFLPQQTDVHYSGGSVLKNVKWASRLEFLLNVLSQATFLKLCFLVCRAKLNLVQRSLLLIFARIAKNTSISRTSKKRRAPLASRGCWPQGLTVCVACVCVCFFWQKQRWHWLDGPHVFMRSAVVRGALFYFFRHRTSNYSTSTLPTGEGGIWHRPLPQTSY